MIAVSLSTDHQRRWLNLFTFAAAAELDAVNNLLVSLLVSNYPPTPEAVRRPAVQLLDAVAATEGRSTPYGRYNACVLSGHPAPMRLY